MNFDELPTPEENEVMRLVILLPLVVRKIEKEKKELEQSTDILKRLFASTCDLLLIRVRADLVQENQKMWGRKIRIIEEKHIESHLVYKYNCRGKEAELLILRDLAKRNLASKLGEYLRNMELDMKANK